MSSLSGSLPAASDQFNMAADEKGGVPSKIADRRCNALETLFWIAFRVGERWAYVDPVEFITSLKRKVITVATSRISAARLLMTSRHHVPRSFASAFSCLAPSRYQRITRPGLNAVELRTAKLWNSAAYTDAIIWVRGSIGVELVLPEATTKTPAWPGPQAPTPIAPSWQSPPPTTTGVPGVLPRRLQRSAKNFLRTLDLAKTGRHEDRTPLVNPDPARSSKLMMPVVLLLDGSTARIPQVSL